MIILTIEGGTGAFGSSLSMDSDTIVVGAPELRRPTADGWEGDLQGAIFVFSRAANRSWLAQGEMILATRDQARSFFGTAMSISGEWIVAGAASTATSAAGF